MSEVEAAVREIEIYGFMLLERVLLPEQIEPIRQALIRCEQEAGEDHTFHGTARHISNLPTLDPVFFQVIDHPRVLPILEHFLGKGLIRGASIRGSCVRATENRGCTATYPARC